MIPFAASAADDPSPRSLDPRLQIQLFVESPRIVTPTGIDVDHRGRVWVIESNTHFPPEGYSGHSSDRVLVMTGKARAEEIVTFTDGLTHAMSIAVRPAGTIYVATRRDVFLYYDEDGDLKPDRREQILRLETEADYPHNALAGFAFDALGGIYVGLGENLGEKYTLFGSDGTTWTGGGEGGSLFRCRADGSHLSRWATGFWNPHASCIDAFGRFFTVDNDPDSRPPCRLLHAIPGGDFGYRFRNGRKGLHPFTAWNGEIPGTLPMVAGTGEAPSGIIAYEADQLPPEYVGNLLVTSWGDHRIDRFRLESQGASITSRAEPLIVGGTNFRPVGLAVAPDGSLYCTDWVLEDYKLHGQGRLWRISTVDSPQREFLDVTAISSETSLEQLKDHLDSPRLEIRREAAATMRLSPEGLRLLLNVAADKQETERVRIDAVWALLNDRARDRDNPIGKFGPWSDFAKIAPDLEFVASVLTPPGTPRGQLAEAFQVQFPRDGALVDRLADNTDPYIFSALLTRLVQDSSTEAIASAFFAAAGASPARRVLFLLAARQKDPQQTAIIEWGLADGDASIRRAAIQWVAEEGLEAFRPQLEDVLRDGGITNDLFLAAMAALEMLDGRNPQETDKTPASERLTAVVTDETRPPGLRARALRMLPPGEKGLTIPLLSRLAQSKNPTLQLEAVRTLQHWPDAAAAEPLAAVATNTNCDVELRAEAIAGLANSASMGPDDEASLQVLIDLLDFDEPVLQRESLRSLRTVIRRKPWIKQAALALSKPWKNAYRVGKHHRELADQLALALDEPGRELPAHVSAVMSARPATLDDWLAQLGRRGDRAAGRRVFFHTNSTGCYRCHTVNGRGGAVGPDLSVVARSMNREKLAISILQPSKEIAPQYVTWKVVTTSGKVYEGLILGETDNGQLRLGTADATVLQLDKDEIEERAPRNISIMPTDLIERLTIGEFCDLLTFLESLK
jgi:putative membrane-bound dehydrogenase-like protein